MSSSIIVAASLAVAHAILTESALSFMGLGVQLPKASWGNDVAECTGLYHGSSDIGNLPGYFYCAYSIQF